MTLIPARLGLQQRVIPEYRVPLLDTLAAACLRGLSVFAGEPRESEAIDTGAVLKIAHRARANNVHLLRGKAYFCLQTNFTAWLAEWQPDALIVEANARYLSTPAAVSWMHARRRPVVGWGLGAPAGNAMEDTLRNSFLHSLDAVIAYSQNGAEQYCAAGIPEGRIFVAANAVTSRPSSTAPVRAEGYAAGKPCILYVGRLQERKKLDILLKACAAQSVELKPRLVIVGDGPDRSRLQQLAWQVYPSAEFVGAKHGAELEPFYQAADLFVLPGTGGLAVQQAMAHALPVIVGEADGTQTELVRPSNGWTLPESDLDSLARAITQATSDLPALRRMGMESYRIVSEEVNIENMVAVFARAVNFVLDQYAGKGE